jgi:Helix-turn-helix domain
MSDIFTRDKLLWLERLSTDGKTSSGAVHVALVISSHLNRKLGIAWPSLDYLAKKLDANERTVRRAIDELVTGGYIEKKRGGDGRANQYRIVISDRTNLSDQNPIRPDKNVQSVKSRPDKSVIADRTNLSFQTGQKCPPNPLNEPYEEPFEDISSEPTGRKTDGASGFDAFWQQYPKKVAKGAARKAYVSALNKARPEEILAGAMRYSQERSLSDPTFTKHPATWLNKECWADESVGNYEPKGKLELVFEALNCGERNRPPLNVTGGDHTYTTTTQAHCPKQLLDAFAHEPETIEILSRCAPIVIDKALQKFTAGPFRHDVTRDYIRKHARAA